jgi:SAM-dependent methyltransferase
MDASATRPTVKTRLRHAVGTTLRRSPAPVRNGLTTASTRVLRALGRFPEPISPVTDQASAESRWRSPEVPLPPGLTLEEVERAFRSWSVNGEPVGHLDGYVTDSHLRFLYTWGLVREEQGRWLELGANPYFTTWLLHTYTDLDLTLANYYGTSGTARETVSWVPPGQAERSEVVRESALFNVEEERFPFDDGSLDGVLFCEMLEHLLMNPLHTLGEIHRILRPGGCLVLTTPNVARLENVLRLLHGANLYDPYSGFGPYGRHNREYTRHELHRLLEFAGFDVEFSMTADGHPSDAEKWEMYNVGSDLVSYRVSDLGHYLYIKARSARPPRTGLPSFLYRSWPPGDIVEYE